MNNGTDKTAGFAPSATSNIIRPILSEIGWVKVHQFAEAWTNYTFQVKASEMEDKKLREALNITASISELVLRLLVNYELVKMGITRPAIPPQEATEEVPAQMEEAERPYRLTELTAPIIERWLQAKLAQRSEQSHLDELKEQLKLTLAAYEYQFHYKPHAGTLLEQLQAYTIRLQMEYDHAGLSTSLSQMEKIDLWIRQLHPWQAAKTACIWMARPDYLFRTPGVHSHRDLLIDAEAFIDEVIHVIVTALAPTIAMDPMALENLNAKPLAPHEEALLGPELTQCLGVREKARLKKRLRNLEAGQINTNGPPVKRMQYKQQSTKRYRSYGGRASRPVPSACQFRKLQDVEVDESPPIGDEGYDQEVGNPGDMGLEGEQLDGEQDLHGAYLDSDTNSLVDCGEEEVDRVYMKAVQARELVKKACSNCNKPGCFSMTCKDPCKFCTKSSCNSWTCFERPKGYGSEKAPSRATLSGSSAFEPSNNRRQKS